MRPQQTRRVVLELFAGSAHLTEAVRRRGLPALDLDMYAADVEAAFVQGDEQPDQQLFMAQPREGLPGLDPKQLTKILNLGLRVGYRPEAAVG